MFWQPRLRPLAAPEWELLQEDLFRGDGWVADGDLGPNDALEARLRHADVAVVRSDLVLLIVHSPADQRRVLEELASAD